MSKDSAKVPNNNNIDNFKVHDLASKLAKDAVQGGGIVRLKGYIGNSDSPDRVCLYLNLNFDECLYIKKSDILHSEELPEHKQEFGGTCIWVRKDAEIQHVITSSTKLQADAFEGEISKTQLKPNEFEFLQEAAAAIFPSYPRPCPPITLPPICQTYQRPCPTSRLPEFCPLPTSPAVCPSYQRYCPRTLPVFCPTHPRHCPTGKLLCMVDTNSIKELRDYPSHIQICPVPEMQIDEPNPIDNLTAQIKELIDQVKAQNTHLKKIVDKEDQ